MDSVINKFINLPKDAVSECIQGAIFLNSKIGILQSTSIIALKQLKTKVHLIGGGGSGHEPADGGFIYDNGLSAAVCGGCFSSPSSQQVLSAIQYVDKKQGVLLIIKNYTGDIINFQIAKQSAQLKNIHVQSLTVRDDIAFFDEDPKRQNARGLAGLILIYQILGNAAYQGMKLRELVNLGHSINLRLFTLNIALGPCSLPGNPSGFSINKNTYELGLGIHGQKGKQTLQFKSIDSIIDLIKQKFQKALKSKDIVILLNNLGGCSQMQIGIILRSIFKSFSTYNILRIIEGRVLTSFEMHGFSVTILDNPTAQQLKFLDIPNPQWKIYKQFNKNIIIPFEKDHVKCIDQGKVYSLTSGAKIIQSIIQKIISRCEHLDSVDRQVGDGDTGTSIKRALQFIKQQNIIDKLNWQNHFNTSLKQIGRLIATKSAGTLGSILGAFIMSISIELKSLQKQIQLDDWKRGLDKGIYTIKMVGKCEQGERTILDVLIPTSQYLSTIEKWQINEVEKIIEQACEKVKSLKASKGRSRYLGGKQVGHPDSGCQLIKEIIIALSQAKV